MSQSAHQTVAPPRLSLSTVLLCGGAMVSVSMGIRHGFGFFNLPISQAHGWSRETFAFAIALQNLMWGVMQPITGAIADRFGPYRVMLVGAALYALGLICMALSASGLAFASSAGLLIGLAQSGTTYSVVYAVIGRIAPEKQRVWAMGIVAAAGSFGQFAMIPAEQGLISWLGWQQALYALSLMAAVMLPLAWQLREPNFVGNHQAGQQTMTQALREAFTYRSFQWLMLGYFVCGFQVVFIAIHLPAYLKDQGIVDPQVASVALALIGLFNIVGTYSAGVLARRFPKRYLLSFIYGSRALLITLFLAAPVSPLSVGLFAASMGLLWLSTIPLTNGLIAQIFGVQYLSMLSGFVFLSHQIGSFLGVWLGGYLYDLTGSYQLVWLMTIGLGVFAALVNLPVQERLIQRPAGAAL